ncbi:MAG: hypothetical protein GY853_10355 [PVC group bacterium]|nr:hypothetical protein [PVC group bacterium]
MNTHGCENPDCNLQVNKYHVHHITPVSCGGSHKSSNLMVLCIKCHKSTHGVNEFHVGFSDTSFKPENKPKELVRLLPTRQAGKKKGTIVYKNENKILHKTRRPNDSMSSLSGSVAPKHKFESSPKSLIDSRCKKAESAIHSNHLLHFEYTKRNGDKSERTIRPEQIKNIKFTLCVSGYCYLRKLQRTFAFKRMRRVSVVSDVGRCIDL